MWPFKKKKVIDLTERKIPIKTSLSSEYKDLTPSESALGFLGSMASSVSKDIDIGLVGERGIQHLKVKIEDIEYKIENLRKKIDSLLDRMDLAEKKIERVDRG